jgi:HK97 gp10 family phage protein
MPVYDINTRISVNRKHGPDGNYNDIAARLVSKQPIIALRTAQALSTYARLTAPQPPRKAWWYDKPPNPRTKKTVPLLEQYVRTGRLAKSISAPVKAGTGEYIITIGAPYAKFVEHGTRYMPPQPFWRSSVKHIRSEVMPGLVQEWIKKDPIKKFGPFPKAPSEPAPIKRFGPFPKAG